MSNYEPAQPASPYAGGVAGQEHPQGTVILVLGILGFFTWITGIVAWVMGAKAEKEMAASGTTYSNAQNIKVGKILGIVTTILGAIGVVFGIISVAILAATLANMPQ